MARVFSDLRDGSGRRYFYSLASAPGGTQVGIATLTIQGLAPTVFEQTTVFRTPALATLTINGHALISDVLIRPAPAALSTVGQIPDEHRTQVVTNSSPLDYTDLPDNAPTVLFINTLIPAPGLLTLTSPPPNVTQGGNIGFVSAGVGLLTLQSSAPTLIISQMGVGSLTVEGLAPTVFKELNVELGVGSLQINGHQISRNLPFQWIDVDRPPAVTWTTTTGIAA